MFYLILCFYFFYLCMLNNSKIIYRDKNIIITTVDKKSFILLENLILFSFKRYNINYPIIYVYEKELILKCKKLQLKCLLYEMKNVSYFKVSEKRRKWFGKYMIINENVRKGYNVLFIDSDVLFLYNCLNDVWKRKEDFVLMKSQNPKVYFGNSGFILIHSNKNTKKELEKGLMLLKEKPNKFPGDQDIFTYLIRHSKNISGGLFNDKIKVGLDYINNCI